MGEPTGGASERHDLFEHLRLRTGAPLKKVAETSGNLMSRHLAPLYTRLAKTKQTESTLATSTCHLAHQNGNGKQLSETARCNQANDGLFFYWTTEVSACWLNTKCCTEVLALGHFVVRLNMHRLPMLQKTKLPFYSFYFQNVRGEVTTSDTSRM